MLRRLVILSTVACLLNSAASLPAMAIKPSQAAKAAAAQSDIHVVGGDLQSEDVQSILEAIKDLLEASNRHDLKGVINHYSPRFVSGDSLTLEEIRNLIVDTWKTYPDIQYKSKILEIRLNGDWATVESLDTAEASASPDSNISTGPGTLVSRSRGLLFLKRVGKTWEILSDYTVYENATILYGDARELKMVLSTPEQVFAGEPYTAKIDIKMPPGMFAIATISQEPLVYPQQSPEEKFRSLSDEHDSLERVFQANTTNNNEMVTVTIGLTQIGQDEQDRPTIKLNGIATVVKRVNVLPRSEFASAQAASELIRRSASGIIDLSKLTSPKNDSGEASKMTNPQDTGTDKSD